MRVFFAGASLFAAFGCNDATTEAVAPERNRVLVETATFTPAIVQVRVNGTVEFAFGSVAHQVIFDEIPGRPENIESLLSNTVEERVFTAPGRYSYRCEGTGHGVMRGEVVVPPPAGTTGD